MRGRGFSGLRERMQCAAAATRLAPRLALVDATVLLLAGDDELWLDFGGDGLRVSDPPAGAEPDIEVCLAPELVERFPDFFFAMAMADGQMTSEGPVREFLAVNPVLRTAVAEGQRTT